jgi:dolichyl-diphosphooligosaccharide--protein glycosyltransferase
MRIERVPGARFLARAAGARGAPASRLALWLGLGVVIACAVYATHSRLAQRAAWHADPQQYIASGVPMMTTLDAYYSLRLARLHAAGQFVAWGPVPVRHYSRPEEGDPNTWYDQREPKALPLLSRVLAGASILFQGDIDQTALVLSPLLSSLFMVPLFWYCWRLGVPAAGLMGGLVGTFCLEYYRRTSVGWVDTDCLNLFFLWTVSSLILAMHREQRRQTLLLLAAAAGAALYAFDLWYGKPVLTLAYVCALLVHLALAGVAWRRIALCAITVVAFANPAPLANVVGSLQTLGQRYLLPSTGSATSPGSAVRYPQVWPTISEARRLSRTDTLTHIVPRPEMAVIGLGAFALFGAWRWRNMAALGPIALLAALALLSSRRFIPYLAPFVGIGWGVIVSVIARALLERPGGAPEGSAAAARPPRPGHWLGAARSSPAAPTVAYAAVLAIFFGWLAPTSGTAVAARPAIPAPVFRDLQVLAKQLPAQSRMWTWWDNGFAIVDTTGFGVYHDGAAQYTPQTNLIAASFVASDPRAMHAIIAFVDPEGNRGIRRLAASATDLDDLLRRVRTASPPPLKVPVYVLFTPDMLLAYPAMQLLGGGDQRALAGRGAIGIRWLRCDSLVDDVAECAGAVFDLRTGSIERRSGPGGHAGERATLRRTVVVEGGRVVGERDYPDAGGARLTLEIIRASGKAIAVYLLDEPAFESNLNQMYVLGRFDGGAFEEVYNDFPNARAFRVRSSPR